MLVKFTLSGKQPKLVSIENKVSGLVNENTSIESSTEQPLASDVEINLTL